MQPDKGFWRWQRPPCWSGAGWGSAWRAAASRPRWPRRDRVAAAAVSAGVPASFADLVEHVGASVVNIKVTKVEQMSGPSFGGPEGIDPNSPLGDFMRSSSGGRPRPPGPPGTGGGQRLHH